MCGQSGNDRVQDGCAGGIILEADQNQLLQLYWVAQFEYKLFLAVTQMRNKKQYKHPKWPVKVPRNYSSPTTNLASARVKINPPLLLNSLPSCAEIPDHYFPFLRTAEGMTHPTNP